MLQPVTDVTLLPVHIVEAHSSLFDAASIMTKAGLKHVLVRPINHSHHDVSLSYTPNHSLGILTDTDICRAVSEQQDPNTTPCQRYANFTLRTINASDEIGDALLTMTRYRVDRLPVLDTNREVIGVLGQSDMLAQSATIHN